MDRFPLSVVRYADDGRIYAGLTARLDVVDEKLMSLWFGRPPHAFSVRLGLVYRRYLRWEGRTPRLRIPTRLLMLYGFIVVSSAMLAPSAHAAVLPPDSDAPPGAGAHWLPPEQWVGERWLPFDEARLEAILDLDESAVHAYVLYTGRTLNQLAKRQGVPTKGLAKRLVAPRRKVSSRVQWAILRKRTGRVLTQSHLSEHMLEHHFHTRSVFWQPEKIFGVPLDRYRVLVDQGQSLGEVAAAGGVGAGELRRRMIQAVDRSGKLGMSLGAITKRQNRRMRARDREANFDAIVMNYRLPVGLRVKSTRSSSAVGGDTGAGLRLCLLGR